MAKMSVIRVISAKLDSGEKCEDGPSMEPACLSLRAVSIGVTREGGTCAFAGTSVRPAELDDLVIDAFDCDSNAVRY